MRKKIIIIGAAGRDFHNFNTVYRNNEDYEIVAFTASQINGISGRKYPKELAGENYPDGIKIYDEKELPELIEKHKVKEVILSYSDLHYMDVMKKASIVQAAGADFKLLGNTAFLYSEKPVISVCAVRTGCGKSQTSRKTLKILREMNKKVGVVRHPMPYGDLTKQICQRFASIEDLKKHNCTIEEMEEYEPYIQNGNIIYAGVDYEKILREVEKEADIILWDGGNNDLPFYKPDLHIVLADPLRPNHEIEYYPGETNLRLADVVIVNKIDSANLEDIETVIFNTKTVNPNAKIIKAESEITVDNPDMLRNKKVLVVEDGPTTTHGGMGYGAGYIAAKDLNAEIIDPRDYAVGSIKEVYKNFPKIKNILPAMGYSKEQILELEQTINNADCDAVVIGTPIDLRRIINIEKPSARVRYELKEIGKPDLEDILIEFLDFVKKR
ncbi:MAG: GTPase [Candidatus Aenigmarchaeota archaeon]|nr:GTPase [Candidatus Aenigmarchaeota archaeon]